MLLDSLADHYAKGRGKLNYKDMDKVSSEALVDLFDEMEDYYLSGEGSSDPEADDLWTLYDYLNEFFGKRSDFELEDKELKNLYEDFTNGVAPSHQYFEGEKVEDYADLLYLQDAEKQVYLNTLLDEMTRQE